MKLFKKSILLTSIALIPCSGLFFFLKQQINNYKDPTPLISVVIPTYNRAHLLERAIDSVLAQTFQDYEIIVVNDGSSDKTAALLNKYKQKTTKIKIFHHPTNKGVAAARNTSIKNAKGKYIALMDSDDYAHPNWLEESVSFLKKNPNTDILVPLKQEINDETPTKLKDKFFPLYLFYLDNYLSNVGNIIRNDFIKKHNIQYSSKYTCGEDYDFWIKMIIKGARIEELNKYLIVYRYHNSNGDTYKKECMSAKINITHSFLNTLELSGYSRVNRCTVVNQIVKNYPNIFNDTLKNIMIKEACPSKDSHSIFIIHPKWRDYLILSDDLKTAHLHTKRNSKAHIIEFTPNKSLTIKWEKWGTESFRYNPENNIYHYVHPSH